jgi:hypothetical protein
MVEILRGGRVAIGGGDRPPPPVPGWQLLERWSFPSFLRLGVAGYERLRPDDYRLVHTRSVQPAGASPAPIRPGSVLGVVDEAAVEGPSVVLTGWAASRAFAPADRVVVFAGRRAVAAGPPTIERPDVTEGREASTDELGFSLAVPRRALRGGRGPVRVFAIAAGLAAPLRFECPAEVCPRQRRAPRSRTPRG